MSEPSAQLREKLAQLQQQLETLGSVGPKERARLVALIGEVEQLIDLADHLRVAQQHEAASLAYRLGEAASEFEATHPSLSVTLGSLIDGLAQMGI